MTCRNIAGGMHRHAAVTSCIVSVSALTKSTGCSVLPKRHMFASQPNVFLLDCQPNEIFILYVFANYLLV